jgi:predicted GIY-YIG superfamily endonuclease
VIVYLIRNTANGKCYIGKTSRPLWHRWSQHKTEARLHRMDTPLYQDMRIYQPHVFEHEVLGEATSSRRIAQMERKFIRIFDAVNSGYNCNECSRGGRIKYRTRSYTITPEHRARINASIRRTFEARKANA